MKTINNFVFNPETKLKDILEEFPWLKDELPKLHENFKMLKNPFAKLMISNATIKMMSQKTGMDINELINKIKELIQNYQKK